MVHVIESVDADSLVQKDFFPVLLVNVCLIPKPFLGPEGATDEDLNITFRV